MKYTNEQIDELFARFRAVYPRRRGANPTALAYKRFVTALKRGFEPDAIIAAAARYAIECDSLGIKSTPYIKQAATWLNQECFRDYEEQDKPTVSTMWVETDSPLWVTMSRIWMEMKGKLPPTKAGLGGQGWYFPTAWLGEKKGAGEV
jgi:hypothetical protein